MPATIRLTLGFSCTAHAFAHMFILLYATVVLALECEFAMPYAHLQWLSVPAFVLFGFGSLPAGWLGDRWSSAGMMAIFFLGTGMAAIVTGLATSPLGIMLGLALIGLFASIYHPVGLAWLVKNTTARGRALGLNGVFGSLGTASAAIVAGGLADWLGWRAAFIIPGLVCVAVGFAFLLCLRRGLIVDGQADVRPVPMPTTGDMKRVFSALLVTTVCVGLIYQSTTVALPKLFNERLTDLVGSGAFGAGALVSLVYVFAALSQFLGGELADRLPLKLVYLTCQLAQIPVLLIGFLTHNAALVVIAVAMVSLNTGSSPAENALIARYAPVAWRSRVYGFKFVLGLGVSSIGVAIVPAIHGMMGSLDALFFALMAFAAVSAAGASLLPYERASVRTARVAPSRSPPSPLNRRWVTAGRDRVRGR